MSYGWGATSDYLFKIGDFAPTRAGWPKIADRRGRPPTNHSSSHKTRQNDLSHGIKIWTDFSSALSQCTRLLDGQTDGQTEISSQDRVCIPCSAVKTDLPPAERCWTNSWKKIKTRLYIHFIVCLQKTHSNSSAVTDVRQKGILKNWRNADAPSTP